MGVSGESFVAVKPPWAQLCHYQRQCQLLAMVWLQQTPQAQGWGMIRPCIPSVVRHLPVLSSPLWAPSAAQEAAGLVWSVPGWGLGLRGVPQFECLQMGSL